MVHLCRWGMQSPGLHRSKQQQADKIEAHCSDVVLVGAGGCKYHPKLIQPITNGRLSQACKTMQ
jgi:hypothetical protein